MKATAGQPESDKELLVISISLAGFVGAVMLLGFVYRGRLRGVRRALVEKEKFSLDAHHFQGHTQTKSRRHL
jgi:hypothetical protein